MTHEEKFDFIDNTIEVQQQFLKRKLRIMMQKHYDDEIKRITYLFIGVIIILVLNSALLLILKYPGESILRYVINTFIVLLICFAIIIFIPCIFSLLVLFLRTRNRDYLLESLGIALFFPSFPLVIFTVSFFKNAIDNPILFGYLSLIVPSLLLLSLICIKQVNEPIFINSVRIDSFHKYFSILLSRPLLEITNYQDGYTQRPIYSEFNELKQHFRTKDEYIKKMKEYINFLANKGELFGYRNNDSSFRLYPRGLAPSNFSISSPFSLYRFFKRLKNMNGLTYINIDWKSQEISIYIAVDDYINLMDVSYYLYGKQILARFNNSIIYFAKERKIESYYSLFPINNGFQKEKQPINQISITKNFKISSQKVFYYLGLGFFLLGNGIVITFFLITDLNGPIFNIISDLYPYGLISIFGSYFLLFLGLISIKKS